MNMLEEQRKTTNFLGFVRISGRTLSQMRMRTDCGILNVLMRRMKPRYNASELLKSGKSYWKRVRRN